MKHVFSPRIVRYFLPNVGTLVLIALLLFAYRASAAPGSPPVAPDVTPGTISYQCMLTDVAGRPVNGNANITFRLYSAPAGGSALWTEAHTSVNAVPVSNGLCHVLLGSLTPIPTSVWSNADVYLGVQVGSDAEMTPREVVSAVPYSFNGGQGSTTIPDGSVTTPKLADGAVTAVKLADGAVTTAKLINGTVSKAKLAIDALPPLIQNSSVHGNIDTPGWTLQQGTGERWYTAHVTFAQGYSLPPAVHVSLSVFDFYSGANQRLEVNATNVTAQGFDLNFRTWGDTRVYDATAAWIAYGAP